MQHDSLRKMALSVQQIDFPGTGPDSVALIWLDLADRPNLFRLAHDHPDAAGLAECRWHAPDLLHRDAQVYLHLQAVAPTQHAWMVSFPLATYHMQLARIARERFLWLLGGPRPDWLMEEHATDPADLLERLTAARGKGITLGLDPVLTQELEAVLAAWYEAQAQQN
jgi:hypothetical protein